MSIQTSEGVHPYTDLLSGNAQLSMYSFRDFIPQLFVKGPTQRYQSDVHRTLDAFEDPEMWGLKDGRIPQGDQSREVFDRLGSGHMAYAPMRHEVLSEVMQAARREFAAESAGIMMLRPFRVTLYGSGEVRLRYTPALQQEDGSVHRVLVNRDSDHPALERAFESLTPPNSVMRSIEGVGSVGTVHMLESVDHPRTITEAERQDWLTRLEASGVRLEPDMDVTPDAKSKLDNFISVDGQLTWCDGNIMGARSIGGAAQQQHLAEWSTRLQPYIRA